MTSPQAVRDRIIGKSWVSGDSAALGALQAPMRPIDTLHSAGLGILAQYVQPLQQVLDAMAGNGGVIQSFTDAWAKVASTVEEVGRRLDTHASADVSAWQGAAGDGYRARVAELTNALAGTAALSEGTAAMAQLMGEAQAGARSQVHRLLTELVGKMVTETRQAMAVEGGLTPAVVARAASLVDAYRPAIVQVDSRLRQTFTQAESLLSSGSTAFSTLATQFRREPSPQVQAAQAPPKADERGFLGRGGSFLSQNGTVIDLHPRDPNVPTTSIPNNVGAKGFTVGPAYDLIHSDHTYKAVTRTLIPFDKARDVVGDAIANNPVPTWGDQPASTTGTKNDALLNDYVRSFRVPSPDPTKYTDLTVNYTIAGEHRLHEGYVIRYGERNVAGLTTIVSYGEGNAALQHPLLPTNRVAEKTWELNQGEIVVDVLSKLAKNR